MKFSKDVLEAVYFPNGTSIWALPGFKGLLVSGIVLLGGALLGGTFLNEGGWIMIMLAGFEFLGMGIPNGIRFVSFLRKRRINLRWLNKLEKGAKEAYSLDLGTGGFELELGNTRYIERWTNIKNATIQGNLCTVKCDQNTYYFHSESMGSDNFQDFVHILNEFVKDGPNPNESEVQAEF